MKTKSLFAALFTVVTGFAGIATSQICRSDELPNLTFSEANVFPKTRSLHHPEDGRALADGRIIVGDEENGLVVINRDGKLRPFGKFKEAGWKHDPPNAPAGPNGVFMESGGGHLLLVNVYDGKIYRVDTQTEAVKMIYDHVFGINSVVRDRNGTIWFTQSAENKDAAGMWSAVDRPMPTGAVFYLKGKGDEVAGPAVKAADGIYFANGIALDKAEKYLYVAETMFDRVLRFEVDPKTGALKNRETYANVTTPDNLAFDVSGNLYIASPISNKIFAVDKNCRSLHTVFYAESESNSKMQNEWTTRSRTGEPLLDLVTPENTKPLPGAITGMFWSQDGKTFYITGLGDAILRYTL